MNVGKARILLTGAAGGIGEAVAHELASRGASLGLVDINAAPVNRLCHELRDRYGTDALPISADLSAPDAIDTVLQQQVSYFGGVDILINGAGIIAFTEYAQQDHRQVERIFQINTLAPMALSRAVLPSMLAQGHGQIVNIGSVFGSIAFAWFASYSASKFALRGFSEALRRELDGSGVDITFIAPRAVRTSLNSSAVYQMAKKVKMHMDEPAWVAQHIVRAIEKRKKDVYLGFPESLFVRINALVPRIVDKALRRQNRIAHDFL